MNVKPELGTRLVSDGGGIKVHTLSSLVLAKMTVISVVHNADSDTTLIAL